MKKLLLIIVVLLSTCICDSVFDDSDYECDGRVYCSEMTSCEEARWFLKHCPDVKMDGDGDGVPCEDQWCR
ncbi:MAG: excalibur calcium-binding domain-containing protein [Chitinispirillaceae bacterium]|nr:excalibur calcium-binding domain-containing protein [Chitinispirillaceae bacterium]